MEFTQDIQEFLAQPHFMVLSTLKKDGNIQMSVVWYEFKDGKFWVSTTTDRAKYYNVKRNPHVTFLIYDNNNPYKFIEVEGKAEFSKEGAHDLIDNLSEKYTGQKPYAGDVNHQQDRINIIITPEKHIWKGSD